MSKVVVYASKWYELEDSCKTLLRRMVDTDQYLLEEGIHEYISMKSVYYSNGNRRVYIKVFNESFEIYSQFDEEDYLVVEARALYAMKSRFFQVLHELKSYCDEV